jgi:hypothetical protein
LMASLSSLIVKKCGVSVANRGKFSAAFLITV